MDWSKFCFCLMERDRERFGVGQCVLFGRDSWLGNETRRGGSVHSTMMVEVDVLLMCTRMYVWIVSYCCRFDNAP